jgi:hypothetical protein
MKKTVVVSPMLPVSDKVSKDNPSHPQNVVVALSELTNQANADTKYDVTEVQRVKGTEGFVNPESEGFKIFIACIVILIMLIVVLLSRTTYVRIACIGIMLVSINYAVHMLEKRTV